ncbi:MAG: thioesterase family protein [Pseudomonadota bacterium]
MTYFLDEATALEGTGPGTFRLQSAPTYWNMFGAFGGWIVASAVRAVLASDGARGNLVSVNAIFLASFKQEALIVTTQPLSRRARTDFWRVSIATEAAPTAPVFSADIVMSEGRETDLAYDTPLPDAPAPEGMKRTDLSAGPAWQQRYDQRLIKGRPFKAAERAYTLNWLREVDGRPLDAVGLAAISDTYMPRTFFLCDTLRMGSTVSFSLNVHATAAELAAIGDDFLLMDGDSDVVGAGMYDQRGRIWSRSGKVIAITNQIGFFK